MKFSLSNFDSIVFCDFEFTPIVGDLPVAICMVVHELRSGKTIRVFQDELLKMKYAPFPTDNKSLFVAYYAPAEFSCFHALGWDLPVNVIDLFAEFRNITNVHAQRKKANLLSALVHFGQDALTFEEKTSMRDLAIRGGSFTEEEKLALLDYCESDVIALKKLFPLMTSNFDLPYALLRGRYMKSVSIIEKNGVPIDIKSLSELKFYWDLIEERLIERINNDFNIFEGRTFRREKFENYLALHNLTWPRNESGVVLLDDATFREMVRIHPQIAPIRELRHTLSQLRLSGLTVGQDGRNRASISAFRAMTGRNQPSNTEFIFGPSCWIRGLIKPPPNYSIAYIDWCQQEFGIAAALSGDSKMIEAYESGDPYLAFAKQAGAVPVEATKSTHSKIRNQFKACALAVQYGMGAESLALRINQPCVQARHLLQLHRSTYSIFWKWSDAVVSHAMLTSQLQTAFGWSLQIETNANERSLRNFPMQANGSEMLRLACCYMTEAGIEVCAPVHDAILILAPTSEILTAVAAAKSLMEKASVEVLDGFKLRSNEEIVHHPDRYMDERGAEMWKTIWELIEEIKVEKMVQTEPRTGVIDDTLLVS